jgi:hypothetical protein
MFHTSIAINIPELREDYFELNKQSARNLDCANANATAAILAWMRRLQASVAVSLPHPLRVSRDTLILQNT